MANKWFDIRIKTEARYFDSVRARILAWPEEVAREVYIPKLRLIAQEGVIYMRRIILESGTETGAKRKAAGGNGPGRYDTGTMYDAVSYRIRKRVKGESIFVGWTEGRPGYSIFQEHGVRGGVTGMNAIAQTQEFMLSEIRKMGRAQGSGTGFSG